VKPSRIIDRDLRWVLLRPVCVLSVGRSGSSLAARAMNLLGVHLGAEEDLMGASEQNERGYWENMAIFRVNEALLEALGGSWYRPPELSSGWEHDARLDELRERALDVVAGLARPERRWGFKDPRTIVLLPFWRQVIGEMDYVICVRRAHAFVRSVHELDPARTEPCASAQLWLEMNAAALEQTIGERRMLVFYEDWFEDPRRVAGRLAAFIHGDASAADPEDLDAVESFFDPRLRRADACEEPAELVGAPELEAMHAHLRLIAENDSDDRDTRGREALVARALAQGYRLRQGLRDDIRRADEKTAASRAETESARAYAEALGQTQEELRAALARHQQWLEAVQGSTSWRMTVPLRAAKRHVQGRRRRQSHVR
jgi:hypothetical protein